jgi:hypothetical protein
VTQNRKEKNLRFFYSSYFSALISGFCGNASGCKVCCPEIYKDAAPAALEIHTGELLASSVSKMVAAEVRRL